MCGGQDTALEDMVCMGGGVNIQLIWYGVNISGYSGERTLCSGGVYMYQGG